MMTRQIHLNMNLCRMTKPKSNNPSIQPAGQQREMIKFYFLFTVCVLILSQGMQHNIRMKRKKFSTVLLIYHSWFCTIIVAEMADPRCNGNFIAESFSMSFERIERVRFLSVLLLLVSFCFEHWINKSVSMSFHPIEVLVLAIAIDFQWDFITIDFSAHLQFSVLEQPQPQHQQKQSTSSRYVFKSSIQ